MRRPVQVLVLAVALVISSVSVGLAAPAYTVIDLGVLPGGESSVGSGVNDTGKVTGTSADDSGNQSAFLWKGGNMINLGTLLPEGYSSQGMAINRRATVVGFSYPAVGFPAYRAFMYSEGVMTDLGTFGGSWSFGYAVNDLGQAAGAACNTEEYLHPFLYDSGVMTDLGTLEGGFGGQAFGINDHSQVVGMADLSGGFNHAFIWEDGVMVDLGALLGSSGGSAAYDINNLGLIVGQSNTLTSSQHAVLWQGGDIIDLGTLGGTLLSSAAAINDAGTIVGWSTINAAYDHAFIYSSGEMRDLNDFIDPSSGWELVMANGISNTGFITGAGIYNGRGRGFLLVPTGTVPAPGAMILGMIGVGALGAVRRIRRSLPPDA